jgi:hypothetical protein
MNYDPMLVNQLCHIPELRPPNLQYGTLPNFNKRIQMTEKCEKEIQTLKHKFNFQTEGFSQQGAASDLFLTQFDNDGDHV